MYIALTAHPWLHSGLASVQSWIAILGNMRRSSQSFYGSFISIAIIIEPTIATVALECMFVFAVSNCLVTADDSLLSLAQHNESDLSFAQDLSGDVSLYSEAPGVGAIFRQQLRRRPKRSKAVLFSPIPFQSLLELTLQSTKDQLKCAHMQYAASKPFLRFFSVARECTHMARCNAPARLQRHRDDYFTHQSPRALLPFRYFQIDQYY